ncbi:AbrB family transcriptional regulator [Alkalinema sp. FACHB-956]|uniref:AbrB family transcriptional regulator n=1 Tax=Alkalinema sp. FACHB-956 TaxID=2692768 RepID=UPI001685C0E1|nr:AbrB family transcriptional regulator [Alkalinema sp. FACHB-956]MBD2330068.1 AbrB family transcriptional regulator [Alkalinema sp. FACHB-956]
MMESTDCKSQPVLVGLTRWGVVAAELLIAALGGVGLLAIGLGSGAWILGGIAAGAMVYGIWLNTGATDLKPNRNARKFGQILIGLSIGLSLQNTYLANLAPQLVLFLGLALCLLLCSGLVGALYASLEKTDLLTGVLSTTPGNIGVMASIAGDYSQHAALVSLVQLLRFTAIITIVPAIANSYLHTDSNSLSILQTTLTDLFHGHLQDWGFSAIVIILAVITVQLCTQIQLPVAAFLASIGVGIAWSLLAQALPIHFQMPGMVNILGQILLGMTMGEYWGLSPKFERSRLMRSFIPVGLIFIAGLLTALLAKLLTPWDWLTCLLVAAPGGSPEMIWIALSMHHDVEVVTASHLVRLLTINLSLPWIVAMATHWGQQPFALWDQSEQVKLDSIESEPVDSEPVTVPK